MTTSETRRSETQPRRLVGWLLILIVTAGCWSCSWFRRSGSASGDQARAELALQLGHTGGVNDIALSPDGKTLASGSADETIRLWDAQTGELKRTLKGHTGQVNSVAFSPNGQTLASGGDDKLIKLWETQTGKELRTLKSHGFSVSAVAFSPDGAMLASGSAAVRFTTFLEIAGESRCWDAQK